DLRRLRSSHTPQHRRRRRSLRQFPPATRKLARRNARIPPATDAQKKSNCASRSLRHRRESGRAESKDSRFRSVAPVAPGFWPRAATPARKTRDATSLEARISRCDLLQVLHLSAQRGWCDSKLRGGLGEVHCVTERQKISQMTEVHC